MLKLKINSTTSFTILPFKPHNPLPLRNPSNKLHNLRQRHPFRSRLLGTADPHLRSRLSSMEIVPKDWHSSHPAKSISASVQTTSRTSRQKSCGLCPT